MFIVDQFLGLLNSLGQIYTLLYYSIIIESKTICSNPERTWCKKDALECLIRSPSMIYADLTAMMIKNIFRIKIFRELSNSRSVIACNIFFVRF